MIHDFELPSDLPDGWIISDSQASSHDSSGADGGEKYGPTYLFLRSSRFNASSYRSFPTGLIAYVSGYG